MYVRQFRHSYPFFSSASMRSRQDQKLGSWLLSVSEYFNGNMALSINVYEIYQTEDMLFAKKAVPYHFISFALRVSYDSLPVTKFVIPVKFLIKP